MNNVKTNVTQDAAVRLMLKFPFWSALYYGMTIFEDRDIPTLCVDGRNLWVNPDFWATLSLNLKISAVAHEIGHKMLLHCTRRGHRNPRLWNIAADYVVNSILAKNGFEIGKSWLYSDEFENMSTEEVYHILEGRATQVPQGQQGGSSGEGSNQKGQASGKGQGGDADDPSDDGGSAGDQPPGAGGQDDGTGDGAQGGQADGADAGGTPASGAAGGQGHSVTYDVPGVPKEWDEKWQDITEPEGSKESKDKLEKEVIDQVQKAVMTAKAHGSMPAGMEAFDAACEPSREPWYNHLHRFMQALSTSEYNWARINRRHLVQHGVFAPSNYAESLQSVVFAIDCSGSVFDLASQANFAGHVNAILAEAKPKHTHVYYFDSRVTRHDELEYGALEFSTRPKGGGGTDFRPVFRAIEEDGVAPDALIILTDCYGNFPNDTPPYPVLWASIVAPNHLGHYTPPFGEVVHVSED